MSLSDRLYDSQMQHANLNSYSKQKPIRISFNQYGPSRSLTSDCLTKLSLKLRTTSSAIFQMTSLPFSRLANSGNNHICQGSNIEHPSSLFATFFSVHLAEFLRKVVFCMMAPHLPRKLF